MNNSQILHNPLHLSQREHDVLMAVCEGLTNYEAGDILCISPRTVEGYVKGCYEKFEIVRKSRVKLVKKAIQFGYYKIE